MGGKQSSNSDPQERNRDQRILSGQREKNTTRSNNSFVMVASAPPAPIASTRTNSLEPLSPYKLQNTPSNIYPELVLNERYPVSTSSIQRNDQNADRNLTTINFPNVASSSQAYNDNHRSTNAFSNCNRNTSTPTSSAGYNANVNDGSNNAASSNVNRNLSNASPAFNNANKNCYSANAANSSGNRNITTPSSSTGFDSNANNASTNAALNNTKRNIVGTTGSAFDNYNLNDSRTNAAFNNGNRNIVADRSLGRNSEPGLEFIVPPAAVRDRSASRGQNWRQQAPRDKSGSSEPGLEFIVPPAAVRDRSASRGQNWRQQAPRDKSGSRPRNKARAQIDENNELNCPTCKQKFTITIFQCPRGHSSCSNCKSAVSCCGICGLQITDMRNRTLEQYITEIKVPCPNSEGGCCLHIKMADLEIHNKECPYRDMQCPLAEIFGHCSWRGKPQQMALHFDECHPMQRAGDVDTEMTINFNVRNDTRVVYLVSMAGFNFLFQLKIADSQRMIYMAVQLIGTSHSSEKWIYEIHLYNKSKPRMKYLYTDVCSSDKDGLDAIASEGKCAMIPFSYGDNFVSENGLIKYKFYIKRENSKNLVRNNRTAQ